MARVRGTGMAAVNYPTGMNLGGDPSHHFYLVFLPLIWIAIRHGLGGAITAVGVVQIGVVLGIHRHPIQGLPIIELQALVAALTLTALYLGVMMDERQRATEGLKQSLRLATAGEMAEMSRGSKGTGMI